ncbi:MAG: 3-hydroxyacyl-CoA dehydrogenase family protein [Rhodospirillales bacterium]|nr:3-hydroxyacyl-CoA dehydrogenase family protein [Rhodospirillales bacterium]
MTIDRIGVVGAGMMGSEIALVFALAGHTVRLTDATPDKVAKAIETLGRTLDKGIERGLFLAEAKAKLANLEPAASLDAYGDCDFIIEAVFEDEAVKAEIFRKLDVVAKPEALMSSNTSSISITVLSSYLKPERRARFLGTHFFSPVSRMKLVEVIPGLDTAQDSVEAAMAVCRQAGKTPIRVKDVVGFAVNRLLHALLIEAVKLVEEGVATPTDIDIGCKLGLGHPVGPFELMDLVTNRLTLQVQEILHEAYGPRFQPSPLLKQLAKAGYDGRKTGRGWHRHEKK